MNQHFIDIKDAYDQFYTELMADGRLPVKDTGKGFWGPSVSDEVFEAFSKLRLDRFRTFFDLGAGDGKIVLIASLFGLKASGMEIDEELVGHANRIKAGLSHIPQLKNAEILHGDYDSHHVGAYDVLYCNPDRPFHRGLDQKLEKEMKGDALLLVYGYEYQPSGLKKINAFNINGTHIGVFMK
jgi:hypothetical protein